MSSLDSYRILEGVFIFLIGSTVVGVWLLARRRLWIAAVGVWKSFFLVIESRFPIILTRSRYTDLLQGITEQGETIEELKDSLEIKERALKDEQEIIRIYGQEIIELKLSNEGLRRELEEPKDHGDDGLLWG